MMGSGNSRLSRYGLMLVSIVLTSCLRAPSFDVLGSFFPVWLVCLVAAVVLTVLARWLLLRIGITLAPPILIYPSLGALFAFALWLIFFH
jgi:hypothetical protein